MPEGSSSEAPVTRPGPRTVSKRFASLGSSEMTVAEDASDFDGWATRLVEILIGSRFGNGLLNRQGTSSPHRPFDSTHGSSQAAADAAHAPSATRQTPLAVDHPRGRIENRVMP